MPGFSNRCFAISPYVSNSNRRSSPPCSRAQPAEPQAAPRLAVEHNLPARRLNQE